MACSQETFIGREPIEDDRGEPTGVWKVEAACNGSTVTDCGWRHELAEFAHPHTVEWFITSAEMADLHAEHQSKE